MECHLPERYGSIVDVPISFGVVLFLAFLVESAVGFGSALVTVSLGGHLLPLDQLFPVFLSGRCNNY